MKTHLQADSRKSSSGTVYRVAFCDITDLISPTGVLIVDPKTTTIQRMLCEKCVKAMEKSK